VNGSVASSRTTVLSAGITTTRITWQAKSGIKQSIDANLVTVRNSRVDLVQLVFELFAGILGLFEFTLEPVDDQRGDDRENRARHAFFLAIDREIV